MTETVQPHGEEPDLVEREGVQSSATAPGQQPTAGGPSDPEIDDPPPDDDLLGPAVPGGDQPGQELAAGEG